MRCLPAPINQLPTKAMNKSISIEEYYAVSGSLFSNKDAKVIGPVLHQMSQERGVTARDVVDHAASPNSPLHPYFEWNDKLAADKYRLHYASKVIQSIRVRYIEDGEKKDARAFQIKRTAAYEKELRAYRSFEVLHGDTAFAASMIRQCLEDIQTWHRKYDPYAKMWERFRDALGMAVSQADEMLEYVAVKSHGEELDSLLGELRSWRDRAAASKEMWFELPESFNHMVEAIHECEKLCGVVTEEKRRNCLKCGKVFVSAHSGNRICNVCYTTVEKRDAGGFANTRSFFKPKDDAA